jgi:hypothetical protein
MHSVALTDRRIAILEDDQTNRDRLSDLISMSGGVPVPVDPPAPILANLEEYLAHRNISMVVCDHRLFERNYASYTGAAAVATSYKKGRGGVLVTAWEKDDAETTIRKYRRWIPALVHARELKKGDLEVALLQADREVREKILVPGRVPHRTIMTIRRVVQKGTQRVVKVVMSQWNPRDEVGFPLDLIPRSIRAKVVPGRMLIAQVNIEAERAEDLFFDRFELPDPDVLRKCQTLFDGA